MQLHSLSVSPKRKLIDCTAKVLVLSLALYLPSVVQGADVEKKAKQSDLQWGLGIAAINKQKPYKDIDRDNRILPLIQFENEYLRLFGPNLEFKLPSLEISDSQQLDFSILASYDFGGYDKDDVRDTPILNGMNERKGGFWAGAKAEWHYGQLTASTVWLSDVSDKSKGQRARFSLERRWMFGQHFILTPQIAIAWQDDKYVDYHYGVRRDEVRMDRAAYIGESAINIEYGIRGSYKLGMQHSIFLDVKVTSLGSQIEDSPLVDSSMENTVLLGYFYRF